MARVGLFKHVIFTGEATMFRLILALGIMAISAMNLSCKTKALDGNSQFTSDSNELTNPMPFNVLSMLMDPKTAALYEYPKDYKGGGLNIVFPTGGLRSKESDNIFISSQKDWFGSKSVSSDGMQPLESGTNSGGRNVKLDYLLSATPTPGTAVESYREGDKSSGGVLIYSHQDRQLKMRFTEVQGVESHADAIADCAARKLRLPTARELFDFCTTGRTKKADSLSGALTYDSRCGFPGSWTMTLKADNRQEAWIFHTSLSWGKRKETQEFRCVGYASP